MTLMATFPTRAGGYALALTEQTDLDYLPRYSLYLLPADAAAKMMDGY